MKEKINTVNLTFWKVREMLKCRNNWKMDRLNRVLHTSGIYFNSDFNGVCFRSDIDNKEIYRPNLICWILLQFPVWRLERHVSKIKKVD